jgi:uncharacterized protein involved in exopolysaccharide biosynthesis
MSSPHIAPVGLPDAKHPHPEPAPHPGVESADLFDWALLRSYVGFGGRAVLRHRLLATTCFLFVVALSCASLYVFPKTYRVQTIIQALRNPSLPTLANAGLYRPYEADAPTRAARETVLRRDNLISLITQTDLVNKYRRNRAPATQLLDRARRLVSGRERTRDEQVDDLVDLLEKRLRVEVTEGTVTITLDWPHGQTAYELVETASQNFLETRHTTEIAMVGDAIAILQTHADNIHRHLNEALEKVTAKERALRAIRGKATQPVRRIYVAPRGTPPEVARLQTLLSAKRRAIADLEEYRHRRLAELQNQLLQYQTMYADQHPAIVSLKQNIEGLSGPSPQIDALRREAQDMEREVVRAGGLVLEPATPPRASLLREEVAEATAPAAPDLEDPRFEYERGQVRLLFQSYSSVLERIDAARVEMDAAQAAFKYRYSVISPPQMPKRPQKPSSVLVVAGGVFGGILFALFACVVRDLRSRHLLERWQIERVLELPVVAEIRR